jgi:hypothetical protein
MFKTTFITTAIISTLFTTNIYASTCTVTVIKPNGKPHVNMRVSGEVGYAMFGGRVRAVTDSNGVAILSWERSSLLSSLFVDGKNRGKCRDNQNLTFVVD